MRAMRVRRGDDDGAAAVEFALIGCFILIPLMFGILTFGIAFAQKLALGNAAREGARYGIFAERSCEDVFDAVRDSGGSIGMSPESMRVEIRLEGDSTPMCTYDGDGGASPADPGAVRPCDDVDDDARIAVRTEHDVDLFVPTPSSVLDDRIEVSSTGVFRCE